MFAQYVHHRQRDPVTGRPRPVNGLLARRHPLFKVLLGAGTLSAFLLLPDRTLPAVAAKLAVLLVVFFLAGGPSRRGSLLRGGLALSGFLAVFLLCSLLGDALSGGNTIPLFLSLARKSFWTLAISLLLFGAVEFREWVYLSRILKIPPRIAAQSLLIILIGGKIAREFSRVPAAWKSRGLTARCLRRDPARATGLLTLLLLRVTCQGGRLEQALIGRGFTGRFHTCFSARWGRADTLALLIFFLAGWGLFRVSTVL